jgi:ribosomal protein L37AE/L43A
MSGLHSPNPEACPYCGDTKHKKLPSHIRTCDAVPTTDEVFDA